MYNCPNKYSAWPDRLKESDLSLIQPPERSGMYQSETDRFNTKEKNHFGMTNKLNGQRVHENKLRKLA